MFTIYRIGVIALLLTACFEAKPRVAEKGVCHCPKDMTVNLMCYNKYKYYKTVEVDSNNKTIAAIRLYDNDIEIFTFDDLKKRAEVTCP